MLRSSVWRASACLLPLLLLPACARTVNVPLEVTIQSAYLAEGMKLEVYANGLLTPILKTEQDATGPTMTFETHGALKGETYRLPELRVKVLFGCGWRESPLKVAESWPLDKVRSLVQAGEPVPYSAAMPQFSGLAGQLWVDNRGGLAGQLGLGEIAIPIPAAKATAFNVHTCDAPIPVTFDGASVGEIPAAPAEAHEPPTIFIDPSGRRCYSRSYVWYAPEFQGGGGRTAPVLLSGRKLYYSPEHIAYVLEEPPPSVLARHGDIPQALALVDAKCR